MRTAAALLIATLFSLPLVHAQTARVTPLHGMAEFQKMKYGFFVHYVWGGGIYPVTIRKDGTLPKGLDDLANRFDATGFANDVASMGVEYVVFTAWHANMNVLYPSKAMDRWLPGHASKRDLIGDMIKACKAKNIPVLLYTHPRDGHDFTKEEQDRTGWVDGGSPNPDFEKFDKQKWNDFINDIYGELVERYGNDILGLYLDEGSASADSQRVVDYPRLRKTITAKHPHLLMMQNNYGSLYTCDIGNQEVFYSGHFANPDGNQWPSFNIPISLVVGSVFWAAFAEGQDAPANPHPKLGFNKWIPYAPEQMFRYTVLQAGSNIDGGGVLWCAGPYADGGWETGVLDRMQRTGKLIQAIAPSIKQTYPSTSYPTASGTNIAALMWGVATQSTDGQIEYLHVLKPPTGSKSLKLPPPADGKKFSKAVLLKSRKPVALQQIAEGVEVTLPTGEDWDPLDTVIALDVTPDTTPANLALRKPFRASSLDGKSYAMLAVDGDATSAWVSASDDPAPSAFVDLGETRTVSKIEIEGRVQGGSVLQASDDFSFANAKPLATSPAFKAMALEIVKATYGKGDKWVDVTDKLRAVADPDGINVQMGISLAGVDPAPYVVKETQVEYTLDGKAGSVTVTEDGLLSLGTPQGWTVELPEPVTTRFLRIARDQPGRCAIAEIRVFGSDQ